MNKLKNLIYLLGLSIVVILTGCSDPDDEVTGINYDRLFTPTSLKINVINRTQVRMEWNKVPNAESYTIEIFDNPDLNFEGTPVKTITGVTENPYIVLGLDGETDYSLRIQAVSGTIASSKWATGTATTAAEQILESVDEAEDITATSITLHWPAGEVATQIVLTPGDITHTVTAGEIAAGEATVTGLTPNTKYKATLMNGTKVRGQVEFTTPVDLGNAIAIYPEDDFAAKLEEADDNSVFAVFPGEYKIGKLSITKNVSIKPALLGKDNTPVLYTLISLEAGVSFELQGVILDGTEAIDEGKNADQAIQFNKADVSYGDITIAGCEIRNYLKGLLYFNQKGMAESITINNCIIYDIECNGGDFFDCRKGTGKQINFTNNTVYNSALARDFFRIDNDNSSAFADAPKLLVDRNTFNSVSNGNNRRMLYIRWAGNEITFTNNILANTAGYYTNQAATNIVTMSGNNYHSAPNFTASTQSGAKNDTGTYTTYDPQFANPASGDFTVGNTNNVFVGDPRWLP